MADRIVPHPALLVRAALSASLIAEVRRNYPNVALSAAYVTIERYTSVSLATLQRIAAGNSSTRIDTLAVLASHLGTTAAALATPPDNPGARRGSAGAVIVDFPRR